MYRKRTNCSLGTGKGVASVQIENLPEIMQQLQIQHVSLPPSKLPPAPPRPTPLAPAPRGITFRASKVNGSEVKTDLQPLVNPSVSLSLCSKQLTSNNWEEKIEGTPPAAPRRTPLIPAPLCDPTPTDKRGLHSGTTFHPSKVDGREVKIDIQPLVNPSVSLSLCSKQLSSNNWEEKIEEASPATPRQSHLVLASLSEPVMTDRRGLRFGATLHPSKVDGREVKTDLQPLLNSSKSLSLCCKQLSSNSWEEKIERTPPTAPRQTPLVPTSSPEPTPTNGRGLRSGTAFHPSKVDGREVKTDVQPLVKHSKRPSLCCKQLSSNNWEEKQERTPPKAPRQTPLVPTSSPEPTPTDGRGLRSGTAFHPSKVDGRQVKTDVQPLVKHSKRPSLCCKQLSSNNWKEKIEGTPPAAPRRKPSFLGSLSEPIMTDRRGPRSGATFYPSKVDAREVKTDLQPLVNPSKGLSLCCLQLSSDNWAEKMEGMKLVRVLVQHHPALLKPKLHEVCLAVSMGVKSQRSTLACAAIDTITELHVHLGKVMDTEAEITGQPLLLKFAQTTSSFILQRADKALDALVKGCSPVRVLNVLLSTGMNHLCAAVKESTALHLHQLMDIIGVGGVMTADKTFSEHFLVAVSKMAMDSAQEVRYHGQAMLKGLTQQSGFLDLWDKVVPDKYKYPLNKILQR